MLANGAEAVVEGVSDKTLIRRGSHEMTTEFPDRRGGIGWHQSEHVLLALVTLYGDVNVVMAVRILPFRSAGAAGTVESL